MLLTTPRLELRPLSEADLDRMHAHWGAPSVSRWLWDGDGPSREEVEKELARSEATFADRGLGSWGVFRDGDVFLGICGLTPIPGEEEEFEISFSIEPSDWRRGYGFEATEAVLHHAFVSGLHRVYCRCDCSNVPSRRLLEKLGTVFELARIEGVDDVYFRMRPRRRQ